MSEFDDLMDALLEKYATTAKRNAAALRGNKEFVLWCIDAAFKAYEVRKRNMARRELKRHNVFAVALQRQGSEVRERRKGVKEMKMSAAQVTQLFNGAVEFFAEYKIGSLVIGQATKEQCLTEATHERARGAGHLVNAMILERLVQPMNDTETVAEHYETPHAVTAVARAVEREVTSVDGKRRGGTNGHVSLPA